MNYNHLTIEERCCIRKYYNEGKSFREIAILIGRNVSTISREIWLNKSFMKGTNENSNGLLREFYPKGRNLSHVGEKTLKKNLALINARPKKVLGYKAPADLFEQELQKVLHLKV